ncbi:uncharacterized protein LOC120344073 [Styela clava]
MALSILTPSNTTESESPEDLLMNEAIGDEYENLFRPSLADRLQIGFMRADNATQTVETEILELKTLTKTVQELVSEMETLKRDSHFHKQFIKAKYIKDLEDTAQSLHFKLQEKIVEMERIHEERVSVVRRSFKQQLQDALVKMSIKYKKYYDEKLGVKLVPTTPSGTGRNKVLALEAELQRNQSIIQMMEVQMEELRNELASKPEVTEIVMDTAELDAALAQNEALQSEISQLTSRVDELQDSVELREEKIKNLKMDVEDQKAETEKEKETSRKLAKKLEDLKKELEKNQNEWKKDVDKMKNSMQENMADEMKKLMDAQKAMLADQEKIEKQAELEKQRLLEEERKKYERMLAKEREAVEKHKREVQETKSVELILQQQQSEVSVLKSRLQRTQKQWEKKFSVLRSSLHALKDESYIRQQLQKQSASLKYASISYGTDNMVAPHQSAVPPPAAGPLNPNKPLPAIRGGSGKRPPLPTNTLPSGPGTEIFTTGAVDSGDEQEIAEYTDGFVPLPSPPHWQRHQFGEYMPSIQQPVNFS